MDFNFTTEEEEFRTEVREFIEENKPEHFDPYGGRDSPTIADGNLRPRSHLRR